MPVDTEVKNALLKRALGFEYEEIHVEKDEQGHERTIAAKKYMPPDVRAIDLWLSNRVKGWNSGNDLNLKGKIAISFEGRAEPTADGQD